MKDESFTRRFMSAQCLTQSLLCEKNRAEMGNTMSIQDDKKENILIVDDVVSNLVILTEIIKKAAYIARPVTSVRQAMEAINAMLPNMILLDITMPDIDGFEYCSMLKTNVKTKDIPVIFISAMTNTEGKERGFNAGAVDFIQKPFEEQEVYLRVNTHLKLYRMQQEMEKYNKQLQRMVNDQIKKLDDEQRLVIYALTKLTEGRDNLSGTHFENVGKNARLLALSLQLSLKFTKEISNEFVDNLELVVPLHDLGKTAIPDRILLKPGKLTADEMDIIKTHSETGASILRDISSRSEQNALLKMAIDIVQYHHEKWDGSGYPEGLRGMQIPLSARITAVVDVYDTLISTRCYKEAYSHEQAMQIMNEEAGRSFDPDIIDVFNKIQRQLRRG